MLESNYEKFCMCEAYNFTIIRTYFAHQLTSLRVEAAVARCCELQTF